MLIFSWIKLSWHSGSLWEKRGWPDWFWQFFYEGLSSFNPKGFYYSYVWSCSLCERRISFCTGFISRKLCGFLLTRSPAILDLFISSDASICCTTAFPPLGNSDHVVVSVSLDFPSNSKRDAPFHRIAYDYLLPDWGGLRDHLRDGPWENFFNFSASTAASELYEWVQVGIEVYITHPKYQFKLHLPLSISAASAAAITHRNHFFVCTSRTNFLNLK